MSEADLSARIDGIRQLGSVVRAMTGIAGARARTARAQIAAVETFSATLDAALAQSSAGVEAVAPDLTARPALVVFCAEQGFVGGFSERVLDTVGAIPSDTDLFLIGSRGTAIAAARGIHPVWSAAMPSRSASLPKFADRVLAAVFADSGLRPVSVVHSIWNRGQATVERNALFPEPPAEDAAPQAAPLTNLPAAELAAALALDQLHTGLTRAALHAFVAENEARMAAMSAASRQIEDELGVLEALARRERQEAITAEIIEIASGAMAGR
ncbi:MAG: F0F1 ATP synthase subunit gamma [Paracoccaceae bacterium]